MSTTAELPREEPPWDELDPGIRGTVKLLWQEGFRTIASCQGHSDGPAWVACLVGVPDAGHLRALQELRRLASFVNGWGMGGNAVVSLRWRVEAPGEPWIEVRWWGEVPFR